MVIVWRIRALPPIYMKVIPKVLRAILFEEENKVERCEVFWGLLCTGLKVIRTKHCLDQVRRRMIVAVVPV